MKKKHISIKTDEKIIKGTIWTQGGSMDNKYPAVILSHGFMANQKTVKQYGKFFGKLGYVAVSFDFCGGCIKGKSSGKSEDMTLLTEKDDLELVLEAVKALPEVDESRVSLLGCSQGGFVSALVAADHPELESLIMHYPALCIPDDARAGKMLGFSFDPSNTPEILSKFPMKIGRCYAEAVMDWDYKEKVSGYKGPVLLIHGTADKIVDIKYAREANKVINNCSYYELVGAGHGFKGEYDRQAMTIMEEFVSQTINENVED